MLMHFLKLNIKGQTPEAIVEYFTDNFKDTLVAVGAVTVGILGAWATMDPATPIPGIVAAIPIGFAFDSVFTSGVRK